LHNERQKAAHAPDKHKKIVRDNQPRYYRAASNENDRSSKLRRRDTRFIDIWR
jgi:hypothetical protein